VTSRQEAHARRPALTYAQLDGTDRIEIEHLEAALAFCGLDSAKYIFGEAELDPHCGDDPAGARQRTENVDRDQGSVRPPSASRTT